MLRETMSKALPKVKINNICYSIFIYPANHLLTEEYQVGQVLFSLQKSMFITPYNHLVLMFGNGFQDYLVYQFPKG